MFKPETASGRVPFLNIEFKQLFKSQRSLQDLSAPMWTLSVKALRQQIGYRNIKHACFQMISIYTHISVVGTKRFVVMEKKDTTHLYMMSLCMIKQRSANGI